MVAFLADLVNTDSGSYNKRGVASVGDRLRAHIEATAIPCEIHSECDLWRFDAEPGRPSGTVFARRKGAVFSELEVTGRAAHSGAAHAWGTRAIEALARKTHWLHRLTDYDVGTTVKAGLAQGGTTVDTVPARATAAIDARFPTLNIME